MMSHFAEENWVDFVRNTLVAGRRSEMQAHLDRQCDACQGAWKLWSNIADVARRDAQVQLPAELLRGAEARFSLLEAASSGIADFAALVFDSRIQPATAGMRSANSTCRQLMYQTGTYCVDVRMESQPLKSKISLVGQIQDKAPTGSLEALPISLVEGSRTVVSTETNSMGEFHMEFERANKLSISIALRGKTLVMPLPETPWEKPTK
jgi:hypothetical protein